MLLQESLGQTANKPASVLAANEQNQIASGPDVYDDCARSPAPHVQAEPVTSSPAHACRDQVDFQDRQMEVFASNVVKEIPSPILPMPDIQEIKKGRARATDATPSRRSARIAKQHLSGLTAEQKAQVVLAKRVGSGTKDFPLWQEAMDRLKALCEKELSRDEVVQLARIFKLIVPEVIEGNIREIAPSVEVAV